MRKILIFLIILILISLVACRSSSIPVVDTSADSPFVQIEGTPYLSYDRYTRVVFYFFRDKPEGEGYSVTGYLSEYYNRNGHKCLYIDDSFVEIID